MNEHVIQPDRKLGRLPAKSSRKALMFSDFFKFVDLPKTTSHWLKKKPFELRTFSNTIAGCCTRASQAHAILRMERLEQKRTVTITDEEVLRVYQEMSQRRYGGGDNGAYETDALDDWRNPETTIKDAEGKPYTIDAYLRLNASNQNELRAALALSAARGIKVCLNLPAAWQRVDPPAAWDIPKDTPLIGEWLPGSWGGHSMLSDDYVKEGIILVDTWGQPNRLITWEATAVYCDEAHLIVDSLNAWRKQRLDRVAAGRLDLKRVVEAVNDVSSIKIAV